MPRVESPSWCKLTALMIPTRIVRRSGPWVSNPRLHGAGPRTAAAWARPAGWWSAPSLGCIGFADSEFDTNGCPAFTKRSSKSAAVSYAGASCNVPEHIFETGSKRTLADLILLPNLAQVMLSHRKVITRIKGGLGNQLFCYAAARRLALFNNADLVIDDVTGFARDREYGRQYALDHFRIPVRKATSAERLEPLERVRRGIAKWSSRNKPFTKRRYLEQEGLDFDERLLSIKVTGTLYLDGLWQSERYFKDVETTIRNDLRIIPPTDAANQRMAEEIRRSDAVALHVRWFKAADSTATSNVSADYYQRAIALMERKVKSPRYIVFSDNPEAARARFNLPDGRVTYVSHNRGDENGFADLWLMTQCRHFITANSTFSWWGAWLAQSPGKIVITPHLVQEKISATNWGFEGLIPDSWQKL